MSLFKCGLCRKFHTRDCSAETDDTIREQIYSQDEDSEPINPLCFEINEEKIKEIADLIELMVETLQERFFIKHFIRGGASIGLYVWRDGRYVEAEEELKAKVEGLALAAGIEKKVKNQLVNEVIGKLKRRTYYELPEEPLMIAFRNCAFAWEPFLNGDGSQAIIPIEATKERPIFHLIPWNLQVDLLMRGLERLKAGESFEVIAQEFAPEAVEVFRSWCGGTWVLLFECIGYCLIPDYPFNRAFMLVGDGANGKSTYLRLLKEILGTSNVTGQSLQDLCLYRFASVELYHKLANIFQDLPAKPILYTGYFKILTGEDWFSAQRKFKDSWYMKNYAKLIFSANELPEVTDHSEAFWRRWIVVEFPNKFPDNPRFFEETFKPELIEKIIALSILAFWGVWQRRGFSVKGSAKDFKEMWMRRMNSVYAYVSTGVEEGWLKLDSKAHVPANDLYEHYVGWAKDNDLKVVEKAMFTRELERHFGIIKKRIREGGTRIYVYQGIAFGEKREEEEDEEEVEEQASIDAYAG
jgi:putative DNA primase/helicase